MMTINTLENKHNIECCGGLEHWLRTIKTLLKILGNQDDRNVIEIEDVQVICNLIDDMLPSDDAVFEIERVITDHQRLKKAKNQKK
jgi:hypothetical protein